MALELLTEGAHVLAVLVKAVDDLESLSDVLVNSTVSELKDVSLSR